MLRMLQLWLILMAFCLPAEAHSHHREAAEVAVIAAADLPAEARATLHAIHQGGPFAYDRDGVVFGNYERVLPRQARGYYHEYTVKTPGARNRGARRIIAGRPGEYYYSADHYQSFNRIRE
ncbi:MAG TPA: ribonuclease [Gallionella sp.]|jgi:ribonuclease T1|nr:ribonuclease domain-containing protein [Gallionella sp.]OGS66933.1 MAG: ribonuclease [Gallionellales bacterium GWA2_54_124]HCI53687.1 ribonuclease [Gallionella sp.]